MRTALTSPREDLSTNLPTAWARLDGVDLLRGLAILFVLLNHVNMRLFLADIAYTKGLPSPLVSSLVWNGQHGVQMFFAVSGFLITSMSIRRWGSLARVSMRDFYVLRFARIVPLLLLLLAVLSALHAAGLEDFVVPASTGGLGRALLAALTFHVNVLEAHRGYLPANWDVLWSLSVEEVFYLFFPLVCRTLGRGRWLVAFLLILVVLGPLGRTVFAHGNEVWQEYSYLGGMDAIALGCLTAMLSARITISRRGIRVLTVLGTLLTLFILTLSNLAEAWGLERSGIDMTILAIGTCMLIASAAQTQWKGTRAIRPLTTLGQRSYEVYLTHMFVVFALYGIWRSAGHSLAAIPLLFLSAILVSGLLGKWVARFYSEPMNRLIRRRFGDGAERLGSAARADAAA